jgi:hypothetical protein
VIKKPRKNEEAKARYRAVENTTTMGCNARKTNKQIVISNRTEARRMLVPWSVYEKEGWK